MTDVCGTRPSYQL